MMRIVDEFILYDIAEIWALPLYDDSVEVFRRMTSAYLQERSASYSVNIHFTNEWLTKLYANRKNQSVFVQILAGIFEEYGYILKGKKQTT